MRILPAFVLVASVFTSSAAFAQVEIDVRLGLPSIRFEVPPPLVIVTPGVQVVEDYGDEVFFTDGYYWYRDSGSDRWYRAKDHRGGWIVVEHRHVPVTLVKITPGKYKHYKKKGEVRHVRGGGDDHHKEHKHKKAKGHGKGKDKGKGRD